jgi:flavin-dependent dehydrogenase
MSETLEREAMEYDVVIVGAGPSGLAAAIRLKQMAEAAGAEISVAVLEKGSEVGAHILSGAVIDPSGIAELLPDWKELGVPLETPVTKDKFLMLGPSGELDVSWAPFPKWMLNHGNYIASLGNVCRWMGTYAEGLGVDASGHHRQRGLPDCLRCQHRLGVDQVVVTARAPRQEAARPLTSGHPKESAAVERKGHPAPDGVCRVA